MGIAYDVFVGAFLAKVTEYDLLKIPLYERTTVVDGYLKRAVSEFRSNCLYDLFTTGDDEVREFDVDIPEDDLHEIVDIVSEGMIIQWLKPYTYRQELLENVINTRDFSMYSPAELLLRVSGIYAKAQKDYKGMIREYSYVHGDLTQLHL